ncbi:putative quinol monooxygenase [Pseudoroseicyclus sp. CXY001]|uniref:putative quinol monooxygenase n=1 Tax=Pseudoroseicyclus sp. CXY001 TaxID=3242492 RepID=UPI00358DB016
MTFLRGAAPVRLQGRLICAGEAEAALVRAALPEHIRLSRAEPGCLHFEVTPTDDPLVWQVKEVFTDAAAFSAHQARSEATPWAEAAKGVGGEFEVTGLD